MKLSPYMINIFLSALFILFWFCGFSQAHSALNSYFPEAEFDNIHVKKITSDSLQSCFIIWVKKGVKGHFHKDHSENLVVIEGRALMTLNNEEFEIKAGDFINIPKGTKHSVLEVLSEVPLKVLSIQSPYFDGTDRVFLQEE